MPAGAPGTPAIYADENSEGDIIFGSTYSDSFSIFVFPFDSNTQNVLTSSYAKSITPNDWVPSEHIILTTKDVTVDRVNAKWITASYKTRTKDVYTGIFFTKKDYGFIINPSPNYSEQELEQILSTFKFLDPTQTLDTSGWKTYTDTKESYSFKYPADWQTNTNEGAWWTGISITKVDNTQKKLYMGDTEIEVQYFISISIKDNLEGYTAKEDYLSSFSPETKIQLEKSIENTTVGGEQGVKYDTLSAPGGLVKMVAVNYKGKIYKLSYHGFTPDNTHMKYYYVFNQLLSTFKFTDKDSIEGRFCGGIAGNLPQNQCPEGYYCQLDGNYPDASGKCTKK